MPGAVPATATQALTNATLPYLVEVAVHGATEACRRAPVLAAGLNTEAGAVVNAVVAEALGRTPATPSSPACASSSCQPVYSKSAAHGASIVSAPSPRDSPVGALPSTFHTDNVVAGPPPPAPPNAPPS